MPINYWSENKNTTCLLCKITTGVLTKAVVSCRWDSNIFKEYSLTEWFCPVWFWLSDPCTCTKWCQRTIRSSLLGNSDWVILPHVILIEWSPQLKWDLCRWLFLVNIVWKFYEGALDQSQASISSSWPIRSHDFGKFLGKMLEWVIPPPEIMIECSRPVMRHRWEWVLLGI